MTQGPNIPTEKDGDNKNRHQRQQSREVIETILLDPFSARAVTSAKVDPLLQKPNWVRLISFEDQQELSKKLNGFMMARMRSKEKEVGAGSSRPLSRSSSGGSRDLTEQEAIEKCDDIKHCIVDLDVAHDRWPAFRGSSIFSLSSNSSTSWSVSMTDLDTSHLSVPNGRPISVIPEPYEQPVEQSELIDCTKKSVQEEATPNLRRISRNDVLRTRRWGRRICIPSHLLRPPLIRRQSSTQHY